MSNNENKYRYKSTDLAEYFASGGSQEVDSKFAGFPKFEQATLEYEKIEQTFGYTLNGTDLKDIYSVKSSFEEKTETDGAGTIDIPPWANAIKLRIDTMKGFQGANVAPLPNGNPGASVGDVNNQGARVGSLGPGETGATGAPGNDFNAKGCPLPQTNRLKRGAAGGDGGAGGPGGAGGLSYAAGGDGGPGGAGASGGQGGDGLTYYTKKITNLDDIRGNGILYNINTNECQLRDLGDQIFNFQANRGGQGNDAKGGNAGNTGGAATPAQVGGKGKKGKKGHKGGDAGKQCAADGTSKAKGRKGEQGDGGATGSNAVKGIAGTPGNPATAGNKGLAAQFSEQGFPIVEEYNAPSNSNTSNRVIVHFFIT